MSSADDERSASLVASYGSACHDIQRVVALSRGFVLLPIEILGPDLGRGLAAWLRLRGVPSVMFEPIDDEAWSTLASDLLSAPAPPGGVVMVLAGKQLPPKLVRGLHLVNQIRDRIAAHIGRPLLWCGTAELLDKTVEHAPDFWSIRANPRRLLPDAQRAFLEASAVRAAPRSPPSAVLTPSLPQLAIPSFPSLVAPRDPALVERLSLIEEELLVDPLNAARLAQPVIEDMLTKREIEEAEALLGRVWSPVKDLDDPARIGLAILRAKILDERAERSIAVAALQEVLSDVTARPDQRASALLEIARIQEERGALAEAERSYMEALSTARQARHGAAEARAQIHLGLLELRANPTDQRALSRLDEAYGLARKLGEPALTYEARQALGKAYAITFDERAADDLLGLRPLHLASRAHPKLDPRLSALLELPPDAFDESTSEYPAPLSIAAFITARDPASLDRLGVGLISRAGNIATARLAREEVAALEASELVMAIEWSGGAAPQGGPDEALSVLDPRAAMGIEGADGAALDGRGAVLGIVDVEGLDLYHPAFVSGTGRSRVTALWDHRENATGERTAPAPWGYGVDYDRETIDLELGPKRFVRYSEVPHQAYKGSHGTKVASLASAIAPSAEIVYVDVHGSGDRSLSTRAEIAEAIDYVFARAGAKPCVVHVGLGRNDGPHDGTSALERFIDALLEAPNRAVVIPAGNSGEGMKHLAGRFEAEGDTCDLELEIGSGNRDAAIVEIWFDAANGAALAVNVSGPDRLGSTGTVPPDGRGRVFGTEDARLFVVSAARYPNSDNGLILLRLSGHEGNIPPGIWRIRLASTTAAACDWHAYLDHRYARWIRRPGDDDLTVTLTSPGTSRMAITVGAWNPARQAVYFFSGSGPDRRGNPKPDVVACGGPLRAASASTPLSHVPASGTSMASALVAGQIALLFQQSKRTLTALEIQEWVRSTADHRNLKGHDPRLGFGVATARSLLPSAASGGEGDARKPGAPR